MMAIRAGAMDRRIVLQRYVETQDESGQPIRTYEPLDDAATVWAEHVPVSGQEALESQQVLNATETARFRIRWRPDVNTRMQLLHGGEVWGVERVTEIGRRDVLEIVATRKDQREGNEST